MSVLDSDRPNSLERQDNNKSITTFTFQMTTPLKTIQMNGKMSGNRNNGYKLSLINTYDNTKTIQSVLALNPRQNNFDMKLGYDAGMKNIEFFLNIKVVSKSIVFHISFSSFIIFLL